MGNSPTRDPDVPRRAGRGGLDPDEVARWPLLRGVPTDSVTDLFKNPAEGAAIIRQHLVRLEAVSTHLRAALGILEDQSQRVTAYVPGEVSRAAIQLGAGLAGVADTMGARSRRALSGFFEAVRHNDWMTLFMIRDRRGVEARLVDEDWQALLAVKSGRGVKVRTLDHAPSKALLDQFHMSVDDKSGDH
jgi:hypothetical protein